MITIIEAGASGNVSAGSGHSPGSTSSPGPVASPPSSGPNGAGKTTSSRGRNAVLARSGSCR